MNKIISVFLFALMSSIFACNNEKDVNDEGQINTIKFFPQDHSAVFIEDIADTSFFRILSTEQDFLLSEVNKMYFSDSLMIIPQNEQGVIYLYDLNGTPVRKVEVIGRSAGKASSMTDVWYDEGSRLIDIYDASISKVLSYDLAGKLVREERVGNPEFGGLQFARSEHLVVFERLNGGTDKDTRLGIYNRDLKFQKSLLPIPEKLKNVNYGRTHVLENYGDSMYYLPFLEGKIYAIDDEGVSIAYDFDVPKSKRAPDDYLNGLAFKDFRDYYNEIGNTDFVYNYDRLYMTDKHIAFNYQKGGGVDRNNLFFSKETNNVLQFSSLKSKALPGMHLLSILRGAVDDYFVFTIDPSQNRYLPDSVKRNLNENSNQVLMFFKLKEILTEW